MIALMRAGFMGQGLVDFCGFVKEPVRMLEVGSYSGESTIIFRKCFPNTFLVCVDPWMDDYDLLDPTYQKMKEIEMLFDRAMSGYTNYAKVKMTSDEFFKHCPHDYFDLVYLDGLHQYEPCKRDIINSSKVVVVGGIIAGHDYESAVHTAGVKKAVDEVLVKPERVFADTTWMVTKK
jgi:predicted O-methyltransferase YrrM